MARRKKTTGVNRFGALLCLGFGLCAGAWADSYALIAGTVFRPNGASLAGAEVSLEGPAKKSRRVRSDARGEFSFRVPDGPAGYTVVVKAPGYQSQSKTVEIQGDERVDHSFLLEDAPK
jgi:hypothetical protein